MATNLDRSLPRSVRINNPGAIEYGSFARSMGATGSDGRYAIFPNMDAGYQAMERLLGGYVRGGQNTIATIIGGTPDNPDHAWAPRNVDNNSTDTYISEVARRAGLRPDQPLTAADLPRVAEAMASYEAGRAVPRGGSYLPTGTTEGAAAPAAAAPMPTMDVAGVAPAVPATPMSAAFGSLSGTGTQQDTQTSSRPPLPTVDASHDPMNLAGGRLPQIDMTRLRSLLARRALGTGVSNG